MGKIVVVVYVTSSDSIGSNVPAYGYARNFSSGNLLDNGSRDRDGIYILPYFLWACSIVITSCTRTIWS